MFQEHIAELMLAVHELPQPVVAAVHGAAVGGGLALALASDLRVASTDAFFASHFIRVGLSSCDVGTSYLLPRIIGATRAAELMLTGRRFSAEEADRFGMLNRLVARDDLLATAHELAEAVIANSEYGVYMTKLGLWANLDASSLARRDGAREPHAGAGHVHRQHDRSGRGIPREAGPGLEADVSASPSQLPSRARSSPLATLPPEARGSASSTTSRSGNHSRDTPRPPRYSTTSSSSSVVSGWSSA